MTDNPHSAPVPVGDVVPGDPPVPINVWPVPAPQPGETMANALGVRLVHNLTHPGELIIDLTDGPQLARAIINARRRSHLPTAKPTGWGSEPAALIVTGWPVDQPPTEFFTACRASLAPAGCVAVLLAHGDPTLPADLVAAGKTARLAYLQHIVAVSDTGYRRRDGHLDIHTDVIVLTRSATEPADPPTPGGADD